MEEIITKLHNESIVLQLHRHLDEAKRDLAADQEHRRMGESATNLVEFLVKQSYDRFEDSSSDKFLAEVADYLALEGDADILKVYFDIYSDEQAKLDENDLDSLENLLVVCMNYADLSIQLSEKIESCGILSNMIALLEKLKESFVRNLETEGTVVLSSAGVLYNCARSSNNNIFLDRKAVELIAWYANNTKGIEIGGYESLSATCMLILVHTHDEGNGVLNVADDEIISYIIKDLEDAMQDVDHSSPVGFSARELVVGLTKLANNDRNSLKILQSGALPCLMAVIEKGDIEEQTTAVECIWALSFVEENKFMITHETEVMKKLEEIEGHDSSKLQLAASGTLWVLKGLIPNEHESKPNLPLGEEKHVMLSYHRDNLSDVKQVKDILESSGYNVWMDEDKLKGDTLDAMADAVEQSAVVLICMSQKYKDSQNCRLEAVYAQKRNKDVIPLRLQEGFDANGWLGFIVGTKLCFNFYDLKTFDDSMKKLMNEIGDRGQGSDGEGMVKT